MEGILGFIITAIKIIFLLGFLIIIHEGGHFIVAKLCKVRVMNFQLDLDQKYGQNKEKKLSMN